jgi:hypothetical protein
MQTGVEPVSQRTAERRQLQPAGSEQAAEFSPACLRELIGMQRSRRVHLHARDAEDAQSRSQVERGPHGPSQGFKI